MPQFQIKLMSFFLKKNLLHATKKQFHLVNWEVINKLRPSLSLFCRTPTRTSQTPSYP